MTSDIDEADIRRVLIVEDSAGDALLLEELLSGAGLGAELLWADRLSVASDLVREHDVDCVLLDLSLPDADGMEAVVVLQLIAPQVSLIVLTGLKEEQAALSALQRGAQDYLVKGQFDAPTLVRAIRYAVARKRAQVASAPATTRYGRRASDAPVPSAGVRERAEAHPVETDFLMPADVAAMLGAAPKTVARWADQGLLPHRFTPGGHRRFVRSEIEAVVERLREPITDPGSRE